MKRYLLFFLSSILALALIGQTGTGSIKGIITDGNTNEPLPFVNVIVKQAGVQVTGVTSDFDGKYFVKALQAGSYDLEFQSVGYTSQKRTGVAVKSNKITFLDIQLNSGVDLEAVEVVKYKVPLISRDGAASGSTVSRNDVQRMPGRSVSSIVNTVGGVADDGSGNVSIRGSRNDGGTFYYIDGIKVRGSNALPKSAINSMHTVRVKEPNREQYNKIVDNVFQAVESSPLSTFSIDVDRASYSNVRRHIQEGNLPPADAVRVEEMINYFEYNYPQPEEGKPFSITTEYTNCPWNPDNQLIHIGIQGKTVQVEKTPPNNLVFLVDVSGSMSSPDKLDLIKSGLYLLVDQLRDEDRVALVVYAGSAGVVLPSTSGNQKAKIKAAIDNLSSGGSTAGGQGIQLAYAIAKQNFIEEGNNRVILATDGDFNVGVSSQEGLIDLIEKKRDDHIFLSVLGVGSGNLQDGKMEQLANKGNGNYNYLDNLKEAKKVLVNEFQSTIITIAKDVKTQIEFNPMHVKAYRMVGYVNRKLADEDFNNDKKDAGELGAGHSVTIIYEIATTDSKTAFPGSIDELKYQPKKLKKIPAGVGYPNEIATVKFRYKEPKENKSKLIFQVVKNNPIVLEEASENCRFSAAVALFGMMLRNSDYVGDSNYESVLSLAKSAKGTDDGGYRAEFIQLLELAMLLEK